MMGEAPKLEDDEALALVKEFVGRAGVPVVVGVSAPGFAAMRALTRGAMDRGAAGVMIAPPSTLRTDEQIVTYYRNAVEAIGGGGPLVIPGYPPGLQVGVKPPVIPRPPPEQPAGGMWEDDDVPALAE